MESTVYADKYASFDEIDDLQNVIETWKHFSRRVNHSFIPLVLQKLKTKEQELCVTLQLWVFINNLRNRTVIIRERQKLFSVNKDVEECKRKVNELRNTFKLRYAGDV